MQSLRSPVFVQLELTERCNHRCFYCSNPFSHEGNLASLSLPEIKRVLDQLLVNNVFSVVLTGGEPFMNREGLHFALDYLKTKLIEVYVNTNLSQSLGYEDISRLKRADNVLVPFHSSDKKLFNTIAGANSYDKVLENLEKLVSGQIKFGVNQVITQRNKGELLKTGQFLYDKFGIISFSATPVLPANEKGMAESLSLEEVVNLSRELIRLENSTGMKTDILACLPPCLFPKELLDHRMASHWCSAGKDTITIGPRGYVRRCATLKEEYGNILREELLVIWNRLSSLPKKGNSLCDKCQSIGDCYSGCEARALAWGRDPYINGLNIIPSSALYKELDPEKTYKLSEVRSRRENGQFLVGNGGGFVTGNSELIKFVETIRGLSLTKEGIEKRFGKAGLNIVTYLYNRGLVND
jgi:radical SAM protein with 4Fe4S-binding SPASM domain